jgi:hypothetical protein
VSDAAGCDANGLFSSVGVDLEETIKSLEEAPMQLRNSKEKIKQMLTWY